ncbi:MAG: UDP-N-acetylenolpyruvoylglucosamine reductase [Acidimicrobiia bacterium]|nr:MAG: UDP-N-acetylenolpyruvoylglucosamine reductase [Acidimicrobiia bacterium]
MRSHPLDHQPGVVRNADLAPLTTYKMGGPARWLALVDSPDDLVRLSEAWRKAPVPLLFLGKGSNLVVGEKGFPGLVVRLSGQFREIRNRGPAVRAGAAVPLPILARETVKAGRLGLEFMVGIPGTVGGAVRQNAGCHGTETRDVLVEAEVYSWSSGETTTRTPDRLGLGYRYSNLGDDETVLSAAFRTRPGDPAEGEATMREISRWRRIHQPGGTLNAGSVFKNPPGDAAGRIIDELGLKGLRIGGVRVSEKHANFFVADPGASPSEVKALVDEVRRRVAEQTGVVLEPEIRFVGEFER